MKVYGIAQSGLIAELDLPSLETSQETLFLEKVWPKFGLVKISVPSGSNLISASFKVEDHRDEHSLIDAQSRIALFAMENLRSEIAIHAAALRFNGNYVVFPGKSMSGKSELMYVANSISDRFDVEVLCDEYILVEVEKLGARNYPRSIHLRTPKGLKEVTDIQATSQSFEISHIVFAEYMDGLEEEKICFTPLHQSEVAKQLMQSIIQGASNPHDTFSTCVRLARSADAVLVKRGEAEPFLTQLFRYLSH